MLRVDLDKGEILQVLLDISDDTTTTSERGLLGIAVTTDWLYVNFTDPLGNSRVDAFEREGGGIGSRRRTILSLDQPYSNHNGGALVLDSIGRLYIGFGDGGASGDPHGHGQNPHTWLGSILRIEPTPRSRRPLLSATRQSLCVGQGERRIARGVPDRPAQPVAILFRQFDG